MSGDTILGFNQTCKYLGATLEDITNLREYGLLVNTHQENGRQGFLRTSVEIARHLLTLKRARGWQYPTLAWYADLLFSTEIGRAFVLPMSHESVATPALSTSWLTTPYATSVLPDLDKDNDGIMVNLLRSLVASSMGHDSFWAGIESLTQSSIYPIIEHFEDTGILIIDQEGSIARDAGAIFAAMMFAFTSVASPISPELQALVKVAQHRLKKTSISLESTPLVEREVITRENHVAVDKIYASKATEIHTPPDKWDFKMGVLSAQRRTIAIEMRVPQDASERLIDNVIDIIRPYVGLFGARLIHLLYEIANDPPYWRSPLITVDTNELLDRLGLKRDAKGYHRSKNRERLRDALNAAHYLEIVGEYTVFKDGKPEILILRRSVISVIGATFDPQERGELSTLELIQHGLPKTIQVKLNFYDGVRRPDGRLGNQYVLLQRLEEHGKLPAANHSTTHELLKAFLMIRYRQNGMTDRTLAITRQTALEKANIMNSHAPRATATLVKALNRLLEEGTIESYSKIPTKPREAFQVVLSEKAVYNPTPDKT